jgi:hypothetical protein
MEKNWNQSLRGICLYCICDFVVYLHTVYATYIFLFSYAVSFYSVNLALSINRYE